MLKNEDVNRVQDAITAVLFTFLGLGFFLNVCGIGYTVTFSHGLELWSIEEVRTEGAKFRFNQAAKKMMGESEGDVPATSDAASSSSSSELLKLRGGGSASSGVPQSQKERFWRRRRKKAGAFARRLRRHCRTHLEEVVHLLLCVLATQDAAHSVAADQWNSVRLAPQQVEQRKDDTLKRRRRAAIVAQTLGAGYTPRIVFLAGLMLRSLQMATVARQVFDPSLGYAAGATLAAQFCQREWLPCIMLGWGCGGLYWSLFRVRPPGVAKSDVPLSLI